MRVTKLIREYVEKSVCEKMPMPSEPENIAKLSKEWEDLKTCVREMALKEITAFFELHKGECIPYYCDDEGLVDFDVVAKYLNKKVDIGCGSNTLTHIERKNWEKACREMREKRRNTINDILVSLELGANRAELEEMLSKIG